VNLTLPLHARRRCHNTQGRNSKRVLILGAPESLQMG
jgi:hypothetical protein